LIDVWKEKYIDNKKIVDKSLAKHAQHTLFFISFFPHLIAGPILKAHDFFPQIKQKYFKDIQWEAAFKNLITGYFLKMVVADNLKDFTIYLEYPHFGNASTLTLLILIIGYSFQIFSDFAGYSLIAIGLAKLFVYNFNINFCFPYISTSFKEFWKRWHISLSTFLMEYLYFPLGGNRKGKAHTYINLIITMSLGGLWHGAAWSYALWGLLHGLLLAIERFITNNFKINIKPNIVTKAIKIGFVFFIVSCMWLFFKLPEFTHIISLAQAFINNIGEENNLEFISYIMVYSSPVVLYHIFYLLKEHKPFIWSKIQKIEYVFYATLLFLIITNSGTMKSFIYFQF
jgi:alginate O-acetyltransferase complex protein AlgI